MKKICLVLSLFAVSLTGFACSDDEVENTLDFACEFLHGCNENVDIDECRQKYDWKKEYNVCKDVVITYYDCKESKGCGYWDNYNNKMSQCAKDDLDCIADVMKNNSCSKELQNANTCFSENEIKFILD